MKINFSNTVFANSPFRQNSRNMLNNAVMTGDGAAASVSISQEARDMLRALPSGGERVDDEGLEYGGLDSLSYRTMRRFASMFMASVHTEVDISDERITITMSSDFVSVFEEIRQELEDTYEGEELEHQLRLLNMAFNLAEERLNEAWDNFLDRLSGLWPRPADTEEDEPSPTKQLTIEIDKIDDLDAFISNITEAL